MVGGMWESQTFQEDYMDLGLGIGIGIRRREIGPEYSIVIE